MITKILHNFDYSGTLSIISNGANDTLNIVELSGVGYIPPNISVNPGIVSTSLLEGQSGITQSLQVSNSGTDDLEWVIGYVEGSRDFETEWSFSTCGNSGQYGPSQDQCDNIYGSGVVEVDGGIQLWTVPYSGIYSIEVLGPSGGAGGGGGTFVATTGNIPLIIAGGGGGMGGDSNGSSAVTTEDGTYGVESCGTYGSSGYGANGGTGGGGGGFYSNGNGTPAHYGYGFVNGGNGGNSLYGYNMNGGFGGGGGTYGGYNDHAGGGGGYSGGSGCNEGGGGGGSFNEGENQYNQSGVNQGHGQVAINFQDIGSGHWLSLDNTAGTLESGASELITLDILQVICNSFSCS